jgi:hypothetical protein
MGSCVNPELENLAEDILRYLRAHPDAADTPQGIAVWWIKRQRLMDSLAQVQATLDLLAARAEVEVQPTAGGKHLYRLPRDSAARSRKDGHS